MATKFLTGADLVQTQIKNLADGTAPTDAVNKQQLDNAVAGLAWKQPVRAAATSTVTLATGAANGSVIDGVTLATGDRILLPLQTAGAENGIYVVQASGAPVRASDADAAAELVNATVYVRQGSINADKSFTQTVDPITLGTTSLAWAQVGGGTTYTAGNGLGLTSTTFSVVPKSGGGIIVDGTGVSVDASAATSAKRFAQDVPSGSTSVAITHGLGTLDVDVQIREVASGAIVLCDVTATSTSVVTLGFATAPTTGQYRVVVQA